MASPPRVASPGARRPVVDSRPLPPHSGSAGAALEDVVDWLDRAPLADLEGVSEEEASSEGLGGHEGLSSAVGQSPSHSTRLPAAGASRGLSRGSSNGVAVPMTPGVVLTPHFSVGDRWDTSVDSAAAAPPRLVARPLPQDSYQQGKLRAASDSSAKWSTPAMGPAVSALPSLSMTKALTLLKTGCQEEKEEASQQKQGQSAEDDEWESRKTLTGTVARLVSYEASESPNEDVLLRGGGGTPVVVSMVRHGGPAARASVKAGDRLVSIDGRKDFLEEGWAADTIRLRLRSPTTMVFVGFVGSIQAEVRVYGITSQPDVVCRGSPMQLFGGADSAALKVCEERVFSMHVGSLFLTVDEEARQRENSCSNGQEEANNPRTLLEVGRREAMGLKMRALAHAFNSDVQQRQSGSIQEEPASRRPTVQATLHVPANDGDCEEIVDVDDHEFRRSSAEDVRENSPSYDEDSCDMPPMDELSDNTQESTSRLQDFPPEDFENAVLKI